MTISVNRMGPGIHLSENQPFDESIPSSDLKCELWNLEFVLICPLRPVD